jgi:MFS family permease
MAEVSSFRAAFAHAEFRQWMAARFLITVALQMQSVAIGWQVYDATGDALALGFVGLVQFVPMMLLALPAGQVADRYDRVRILSTCFLGFAACAAGLLALSVFHAGGWPFLAVLLAFSVPRAFAAPAGQALLPDVVPPKDFQNAVAWSSTVWEAGAIAGPALGGALYAVGARWVDGAIPVYSLALVLEIVSFFLLIRLPTRPAASAPRDGRRVEELLEGLRFLRAQPVVLGAIGLDLFAVLLGGAVALMPMFAKDILEVGPWGLGLLRSAPSIGAGLMAVWVAAHPVDRGAGKVLLASVAAFGVCTIGFGLSRHVLLSALMLAGIGAFDMVSVVIRQTLISVNTPREMRGRVSAVNQVFIGASNELGEFESGVTARFLGAVRAVVVGGVGTVIVVGLWAVLFPSLRRADRLVADEPAASGGGG